MHVVTHAPEPVPICGGTIQVVCLPAARDNLVWLLVRDAHAVVVDGPDAEATLAYVDAHGLTLDAVLDTHTHHDHVGINKDLIARGRLPARVIGSRRAARDVPGLTEPVSGGDTFRVLDHEVRVIDTEGHIDGHVSYVIGDAVFSGDTLFTGGCGRMFAGPPAAFQAGLARLAALPDDTRVFCGHEYTEDNLRFALSVEPDNVAIRARASETHDRRSRGECCVPSTMGIERATNPFLRWSSPTLVANVARALDRTLDPEDHVAVWAATRSLKDRGDYKR